MSTGCTERHGKHQASVFISQILKQLAYIVGVELQRYNVKLHRNLAIRERIHEMLCPISEKQKFRTHIYSQNTFLNWAKKQWMAYLVEMDLFCLIGILETLPISFY